MADSVNVTVEIPADREEVALRTEEATGGVPLVGPVVDTSDSDGQKASGSGGGPIADSTDTESQCCSPVGAAKDRLPPLHDIIENIGFGFAQVKALFFGGGVYFGEGAVLLVEAAIVQSVAQEWNLTPYQRGSMMSTPFMGMLLGNAVSGPFGDRFGRRRCLLLAYAGMFMFYILASCARSISELLTLMFFVGLSLGLGQPAWNALSVECTPSTWRVLMQCLSLLTFAGGEVYSCIWVIRDDPTMMHLHWRRILRLSSIPVAISLVFCAFMLRESPSFLAINGHRRDARTVLRSLRDDNGLSDLRVRFRPSKAKTSSSEPLTSVLKAQTQILFGPEMFASTLVVMYSCLILNLVGFGSMYAYAQVLPSLSKNGTAASELLIGCLWEGVGDALGCLIGMTMARKPAIKFYLVATIVSLLMFAVGSGKVLESPTPSLFWECIAFGGYYGSKLAVATGFCLVYLYAAEVYPTSARITGNALGLASGRLGSIVAPVLFEAIMDIWGDFRIFFYFGTVVTFSNLLAIDLLRYETAGMPLQDTLPVEDTEKMKLAQDECTPSISAYGSTEVSAATKMADSTGGSQP